MMVLQLLIMVAPVLLTLGSLTLSCGIGLNILLKDWQGTSCPGLKSMLRGRGPEVSV